MGTQYIKDNAGIQIKRVSQVLDALVKEAKLDRRGKGKSGSPFEYRPIESPFSIPALYTEQRMDMPTKEEEWPVTMTF